MGDERRTNVEYAEDVDVMILEYLIYRTTKRCVEDFMTRRVNDAVVQPSQDVLTQLHILDGFLRIRKANNQSKELDEEVHLWLELLELVVLISFRHVDYSQLCTSEDPATSPGWRNEDPGAIERRHYWLSVRKETSNETDRENGICSAWDGFCNEPHSEPWNSKPRPTATLSSISPLFFTISARIAGFIDQGISEQWVELAAQFMLQTALESLLTAGESRSGENLLALGFAWGWIPSKYWEDYESGDETSLENEMMINNMFEDDQENGISERQIWQGTRLKYMSLFGGPPSGQALGDSVLAERLQKITREYPIYDFERKAMVFFEGMWEFCRKPLLVQIEEGRVEGMTNREFEDFKKRIFVSI